MQTILGSGGIIGNELAKILPTYTTKIRLVSRHPKAINPTDELFAADLTNAQQVMEAVAGSEIAYLTAGLTYNRKIWEATWPSIMRNVLNACIKHKCKLVFFDNIYMYDANFLDGMTEDTPINPPSRKGKVREAIAQMLLDAVAKGELTALIARSADFYGPGNINSILTQTVFKNFASGKKANWMGKPECKHSFTYTPDAAMGTAILGNSPEAYGKVWHLPTASNPPTGKQWIEAIAKEMKVAPKYSRIPEFMVGVLGLFIPIMREFVEMAYQNNRDYVFDSNRFEKQFDFKPTPYADGIRETIKLDYSINKAIL